MANIKTDYLDPALEIHKGFPKKVRILLAVLPAPILLAVAWFGPLYPTQFRSINILIALGIGSLWALLALLYKGSGDVPETAPIFEESEKFQELALTDSEKKKDIIHALENQIEEGKLPADKIKEGAMSPWSLDRIIYYIYEENHGKSNLEKRGKYIERELEKVERADGKRGAMPLYYAVRSAHKLATTSTGKKQHSVKPENEMLFQRVLDYLKKHPKLDKGGEIKNKLREIITALKAP